MQNGHDRESGGCVELGFSKKLFDAIIGGADVWRGAIVLDAALWLLGRRRHYSRDKDGGHIIGSAMAETPCVRKLHGSVFYTSEVIAD